ncbi:uncharacterized protein LOC106013207 [Aplysia californica]|uniref:Uncharacterized protein LOC106013207 n=1 Tax=Aplysia californica TaxID=6500 RepID=A0ABM1AA49_APLCA|nr:uncharacterized protein LOC106013207 [Aplysia californica]
MGPMLAVMDGIEFRTGHNDYRLQMPSKTSRDFGDVQDIKFPRVPPEITAHKNVEDQIAEMREWFRAFAQQNSSHRDYTKYFKPVVCYLEGVWTLDNKVEEPFQTADPPPNQDNAPLEELLEEVHIFEAVN